MDTATIIKRRAYRFITTVWGSSLLIATVILAGCAEGKRYEISMDDNTPPGTPVLIDSKPLPGGARIFYRIPTDEDVLAVEASYLNHAGEPVRFISSYFKDSLDVLGFGKEGEHEIGLCAVDRAGNRSKTITETVTALESPVSMVAGTVQVLPSFGSMMLKWRNVSMEPVYVYVDFSYTQHGVEYSHSNVFTSHQLTDTRTIDGLSLTDNEPVTVDVSVKDKFGNSVSAGNSTVVLLTDEALDKSVWSLPAPGFDLGGYVQANGSKGEGEMSEVIDGITEETVYRNFYQTDAVNPWNIIIDLGRECELSRIVTHQRYSGDYSTSEQGNYYRGNNVLSYEMYVWNGTASAWEYASRNDIKSPVVKHESDYRLLGDAGDQAYLYPDEPRFSIPTRYFLFRAVNGNYISEITLYGK